MLTNIYRRNRHSKINKLHERSLRLVYDKTPTFEELLQKDKSFTVHHYNRQARCIELWKVSNNLY